jgi:hypothetical protein
VQALHQDFFNEILRRLRGKMRIEMFDDDPVDAAIRQRLQFVAQVGDAGWRFRQIAGSLGKKFTRMRLKGHDCSIQPQFGRRFAHACQQGLMPAMHAVEITYRQCAWRTRLGIG